MNRQNSGAQGARSPVKRFSDIFKQKLTVTEGSNVRKHNYYEEAQDVQVNVNVKKVKFDQETVRVEDVIVSEKSSGEYSERIKPKIRLKSQN
jgi:hypothetical protein